MREEIYRESPRQKLERLKDEFSKNPERHYAHNELVDMGIAAENGPKYSMTGEEGVAHIYFLLRISFSERPVDVSDSPEFDGLTEGQIRAAENAGQERTDRGL